MIRCHLSRLMGERKLKVAEVSRQTGLSRKAITALFKETGQRVEFETLDRLCRFFECSIGEMMEYIPDEPGKRSK
jgi:putative transcriptional regulator